MNADRALFSDLRRRAWVAFSSGGSMIGAPAVDRRVLVYLLHGHYSFNSRDGGEPFELVLANGFKVGHWIDRNEDDREREYGFVDQAGISSHLRWHRGDALPMSGQEPVIESFGFEIGFDDCGWHFARRLRSLSCARLAATGRSSKFGR